MGGWLGMLVGLSGMVVAHGELSISTVRRRTSTAPARVGVSIMMMIVSGSIIIALLLVHGAVMVRLS
jgi:hypothetical protein